MIGPLRAVWVFRFDACLVSAAHVGSGEDDEAMDAPVLLDDRSGNPLLPGTAIAGMLRESILGHLLGPLAPVPPKANRSRWVEMAVDVFGAEHGDVDGFQSSLVTFDAVGSGPNGAAVELEMRDGVALRPDTAVAEPGAKFDLQVVPAGTRFPVRLELPVVGREPASPETEGAMVALVEEAIAGLGRRGLAIGARGSRGLGAMDVDRVSSRRHRLADLDDWQRWLQSCRDDDEASDDPDAEAGATVAAVDAALDRARTEAADDLDRARVYEELDVTITSLSFPNGILVRSLPHDDGPDVAHLRSGGQWVLPGPSLAGAVRAYARRVAAHVKGPTGRRWVEALLGPERPQTPASPGPAEAPDGEADTAVELSGSRLRVSETALDDEHAHALVVTRIRLDPFTQGVVSGALLQEEVLYGARADIRLVLPLRASPGGPPAAHQDALCGLASLLARDFACGAVVVGGAGSVGRGWIEATSDTTVSLRRGGEHHAFTFVDPGDGSPAVLRGDPGATEAVNRWVAVFRNARLEEEP